MIKRHILSMRPSQASNNYLAGQIGPVNDPLYARNSLVGPMGHPYRYSYDFNKVKTNLVNEVIVAGPFGPAITIWLAR